MRSVKLLPQRRLSCRSTAVGPSNAKSSAPPPGSASDTRRTLPENRLVLPGVNDGGNTPFFASAVQPRPPKREAGKFMLSRTPSGRWSASEANSALKATRPSDAATRRVVPCPSCTSRKPFRIQDAVPVFALGNLLNRSAREKAEPCQPSAYTVGKRASPVSPKVTCPSRVSFASMSARALQAAAQMAANASRLVVFMVFLSAGQHRARRCHLILKS